MKTALYILAIGGLLFATLSCESLVSGDENPVPSPEAFSCTSFAYQDTIFYLTDSAVNRIRPITAARGNYSAIPEGLAIDALTGEIDINRSESGLRYRVSFQAPGSNVVCNWELVIAGINYEDKVYILDQNDTLALPIFNAGPALPGPCDDDDDDDGADDDDDDGDDDNDSDDDDDSCKFDDDEGTGQPSLGSLGVKVGSSSGKINLKKTLENGAFGVNPVNGAKVDGKLFYRLNDGSLRARNSLSIRLFYFEKLADVPQSLLDEIEEKRKSILGTNVTGGISNGRLAAENPKAKPRPPFLVVVGRLQ